MMKLGVNVDHVATLRQARKADVPDPVKAAQLCEQAGCNSIVCHLREDRRHIQDSDLRLLRKIVKTRLNLEMSCAAQIVNVALNVRPDQATLVPERRAEVTTEGGMDVLSNQNKIEQVVKRLAQQGIQVSLFIDPEEKQIKAAHDTGAECIELHTGRYANAKSKTQAEKEQQSLCKAAVLARDLRLHCFAGHGLNYQNVQKLVQITQIEELNIGHAIIARAVFVGIEKAVQEMLALIGSKTCANR